MSFGFSGAGADLFGVGELADRITHDVKLANSASTDVHNLTKELATISGSILLLTGEDYNSDHRNSTASSIVSRFSTDRMIVLLNEASRTKDTLVELEEYVRKHHLLVRGEGRGALRRGFDRLKYARDSRAMGELRVRLDQHACMLQLLLTSMPDASLRKLLDGGRGRKYGSVSSL